MHGSSEYSPESSELTCFLFPLEGMASPHDLVAWLHAVIVTLLSHDSLSMWVALELVIRSCFHSITGRRSFHMSMVKEGTLARCSAGAPPPKPPTTSGHHLSLDSDTGRSRKTPPAPHDLRMRMHTAWTPVT